MPYKSICISSGHGKHVSGAVGYLNEVNEARRVVDQLEIDLSNRGVSVITFHDDTSYSQDENLNTIVNFHNRQYRDLDVSVHFNASKTTDAPVGTEVFYVTQQALAKQVSAAIASVGFKDRGAKDGSGLFFLNHTEKPALLLEICFVDSKADTALYNQSVAAICAAIADVLGGSTLIDTPTEPPIDETQREVVIDITAPDDVNVVVKLNDTVI